MGLAFCWAITTDQLSRYRLRRADTADGPYILSVRLRKGALGGEVLLKHFVKEVAMVAAQVNGFKEIEAKLKILQRVE